MRTPQDSFSLRSYRRKTRTHVGNAAAARPGSRASCSWEPAPLPSHPGCAAGGRGSCSLGPTTDATWPQPGSGVKGSDIAEVRGLKDALSYSSSSVSPRLRAVGPGQRWAGTPVRDPRLPHSPAHPRVASELWRGERAFALPRLCSPSPPHPRPPPSLPFSVLCPSPPWLRPSLPAALPSFSPGTPACPVRVSCSLRWAGRVDGGAHGDSACSPRCTPNTQAQPRSSTALHPWPAATRSPWGRVEGSRAVPASCPLPASDPGVCLPPSKPGQLLA